MTTVMASYKLHPYEPMTALHPGWDDSLQDLLLQPGSESSGRYPEPRRISLSFFPGPVHTGKTTLEFRASIMLSSFIVCIWKEIVNRKMDNFLHF